MHSLNSARHSSRLLRARIPFALLGILLALTVHFLVGCSSPMACDEVQVKVRLVDDETGEPVSRETMYAHAFNDSLGKQVSLKPGGDDRFELCIAGPEIRLRIPDLSDTYFLFEQDYAVEGSMLDIEVRLKPTHWILLHGTMQWEDGNGDLHPLYEGGAIARKASLSAGPVGLSPFDDGHYSVRAPRKLLEFLSINTSYVHSPRVVDLRGETGDEYELNFVFRPSGLDD